MGNNGPLEGLRVLELGSLIAGPFAGRLFADFGARVIKVEPPTSGDPLRKWRMLKEGTSLWWYVQSRNKECISVNLKDPEGQKIIHDLVKETDIVVENFKPGTLKKWNLDYETLKKINPRLIMVCISGYGQDGPYHDRAGFGSVGEAMGGIRHLTGYPDLPPTRAGISIGDSIAALYVVMSSMMALHHLQKTGEGQMIDVALYEVIFSLMESLVPEYDQFNFIRERTGNVLPGIAPSNIYLTKDKKYIVIGANGDSIFKRLTEAMGRSDLKENPKYANNEGRAKDAKYLDEQIEAWTSSLDAKEALAILEEHNVPSGAIYDVKDMFEDIHFQARQMIQSLHVDGIGQLKMPGIVPKFSKTPGKLQWAGPKLGEHNKKVLQETLGLDEKAIERLQKKGVI